MQMLNPFPVQFLSVLAYFLLRVMVGALLIRLGAAHVEHRRELVAPLTFSFFPFGRFAAGMLIFFEMIAGTLFVLGFATQIIALLTLVYTLKMLILHRRFPAGLLPGTSFYLLLFATSASLFITGAGAFGFDLPI